MSQPSTKKEEFKQLPRPYKQLQFASSLQNTKILREATALKELPSVLTPSNDRRIPLPPLIHYGYALNIDRMNELLEQKLGFPPRILDANPFGVLVHLQREVFHYGIKFESVYLNGTNSMFFIAISSNWEPSRYDRLEEVVKKMKDFLEVDEEPVWCLDSHESYWRK